MKVQIDLQNGAIIGHGDDLDSADPDVLEFPGADQSVTGFQIGSWLGPEGQRTLIQPDGDVQATESLVTGPATPARAQVLLYDGTPSPGDTVVFGGDGAWRAGPTDISVPGQVLNAAGVRGNALVDLTWDPPASDGGSDVTSYVITSTPDAGTTPMTVLVADLGDPDNPAATVTGLTNGTGYTFTVHAVNEVGAGVESAATASLTPATVPGAPTAAVATPGSTQASVAFTAPASTGGSAITGYTATSSPGGFTHAGASSPLVVTGLTNGVAYTFTVHATNAVGSSAESAASAPVTPA